MFYLITRQAIAVCCLCFQQRRCMCSHWFTVNLFAKRVTEKWIINCKLFIHTYIYTCTYIHAFIFSMHVSSTLVISFSTQYTCKLWLLLLFLINRLAEAPLRQSNVGLTKIGKKVQKLFNVHTKKSYTFCWKSEKFTQHNSAKIEYAYSFKFSRKAIVERVVWQCVKCVCCA